MTYDQVTGTIDSVSSLAARIKHHIVHIRNAGLGSVLSKYINTGKRGSGVYAGYKRPEGGLTFGCLK